MPHQITSATCPKNRLDVRRYAFRNAGFTLLEILTAMALFFLVAGILASGVAQAIRVAEVGGIETAKARDQTMRLAWFREIIGLTVLPPNDPKSLDRPIPLIGKARSLSGLTVQSPLAGSHAPAKYQFELKFDPERGQTQLTLADVGDISSANVESKSVVAVLAAWPGSEGYFRYLDDNDRWQDVWPIPSTSNKVDYSRSQLPKAVELRYDTPIKSVVVAIQDRALPLPSIRELMQ